MARKRSSVPAYLLHQPTGQARCRIAGRDFYLGQYGSEESRIRYGQLIAKLAGGHSPNGGPLLFRRVGRGISGLGASGR